MLKKFSEFMVEGIISEATLEKLSLRQLEIRHAKHDENDQLGHNGHSIKAAKAIENHVKTKYGEQAHSAMLAKTEKHSMSGGHDIESLHSNKKRPIK